MRCRHRLSLTILALATIAHLAIQSAMADKVDDDIAGVLMSVSGYGNLRPITGGVVGEDVSRTLIPRILDESELKPRTIKRRGRRSK